MPWLNLPDHMDMVTVKSHLDYLDLLVLCYFPEYLLAPVPEVREVKDLVTAFGLEGYVIDQPRIAGASSDELGHRNHLLVF